MQHFSRASHALFNLGLGRALDTQAKRHIALHRHGGVERVRLKHHADVAIGRISPRHVLAIDLDAAVGHVNQSGDTVQQGRLAAARGAQQHEKLTLHHIKVEVPDDFGFAEADAEIADVDASHIFTPLPHRRRYPAQTSARKQNRS